MTTHKTILALILTGSVLFLTGCGQGRPAGFPAVAPCNITVTKNGQPLDKVVVMLSPSSGGGQWICSGITGANGVAEMTTILSSYSEKGIPEMELKVSLTRPIEVDFGVPPEEAIKMSEAEAAKLKQEIDKKIKAARIIPEILESIATTPVKITVSKGKSAYAIELNDYK
jgi:hypothetical protein